MLKPNGAAELTAFTEKSYKETITPIVPGIWHVLGVGHSNAVIIEGRTSVVRRYARYAGAGQSCWRLSGAGLAAVKTILYARPPGSPGRAEAFFGGQEIIARAPAAPC
ncbi:MAG: hypothetical protein ACLTTU_13065 [Bilophila wadsworthia]